MGEFAAKPTTQLAVQRPSAPTISVVILQILINIIILEPGRFSVQKARMNNQLREFLTATQTLHVFITALAVLLFLWRCTNLCIRRNALQSMWLRYLILSLLRSFWTLTMTSPTHF